MVCAFFCTTEPRIFKYVLIHYKEYGFDGHARAQNILSWFVKLLKKMYIIDRLKKMLSSKMLKVET